jgi:hypothetical protein
MTPRVKCDIAISSFHITDADTTKGSIQVLINQFMIDWFGTISIQKTYSSLLSVCLIEMSRS